MSLFDSYGLLAGCAIIIGVLTVAILVNASALRLTALWLNLGEIPF